MSESRAQAPAKIHTYPEMNETLKDLLRRSEEPMNQYILARIEELETKLKTAELLAAKLAVQHMKDPEPDTPLTLEELLAETGNIVYCIPMNDWVKVTKIGILRFGTAECYEWADNASNYGKTWIAYRNKPKARGSGWANTSRSQPDGARNADES